jgi:nitroimidazol reductase NimA-like FMN-containing flavoprotein (pyridoxamine 5'-phosphate oxidase superfamily)
MMSHPENTLYPQAFPMTFEEVESFLALPLIAKLSSHNKDGTIHTVPIWFMYQNGEILLGTQEISQKIQNIKRDSRVTVMVDTTEPRLKGVMVYGNAKLEYEDVIPTRISIFQKYLGPEGAPELAKKLANTWTPVVIRIKPDQIISFDYSKGFGLGSKPITSEIQI